MANKLAVTLMVKNESLIIERCLKSILHIADLVIITDTGSIDDTIIRAGLFLQSNNINYKIYTEPFKDFSYNRNKLLDLAAQEPVDYVLQIDADEVLEFDAPDVTQWKENLSGDYYDVIIKAGPMIYNLPRLTKNYTESRYEGVTHEYLKSEGVYSGVLSHVIISQINDSRRRVTNNKYPNDAKLLEAAIKEESNEQLRARYIFYLAQTYQAMGEIERAKENYIKRSGMGGWKEEIFYCYYQLGKISEQQNGNGLDYYIKAYEASPVRAESLAALRDYFLKQGHSNFAEILNNKIISMPRPAGLFIEQNVYVK